MRNADVQTHEQEQPECKSTCQNRHSLSSRDMLEFAINTTSLTSFTSSLGQNEGVSLSDRFALCTYVWSQCFSKLVSYQSQMQSMKGSRFGIHNQTGPLPPIYITIAPSRLFFIPIPPKIYSFARSSRCQAV